MPRHLLQREVDIIAALGVEIEYGVKLGRDMSLAELKEQYDAVFLGTGAFTVEADGGRRGGPGLRRVSLTGGIDYLRAVALGEPIGTRKQVIVVGGGNTAIDCVRVALREGAEESILLYRRTRKEMPAESDEVDDADEEGVQFNFLVLPTKLLAENRARSSASKCSRWNSASRMPRDGAARSRCPAANSSSRATLVIPAIGQDPDLDYLDQGDYGIKKTRWNSIVTHGGTMMTDNQGVFAGGDCEYGAMTVVLAVGHGRRAARVMHRYLTEGKSYLDEEDAMEDIINGLGAFDKTEQVGIAGGLHREHQPKVHGAERTASYEEIELAMPESQAVREAERCLRCYRVGMLAVNG